MCFFAGCNGFKLHLSLLCSNRGQTPDMWFSMKKPDFRPHLRNWQVLENLPPALLYIGAIYAALFLVGLSHRWELSKLNMFVCSQVDMFQVSYCVWKSLQLWKKKRFCKTLFECVILIYWKVGVCERLKAAMAYLVKETFTRKDFYLLWLTRLPHGIQKKKKSSFPRFLFLVVGSGFLAHWKNLAFTQSQDDKLVSIIGGTTWNQCRQPIEMTGGTPEVRSDKNLTLSIFDIWHSTNGPMAKWTNGPMD